MNGNRGSSTPATGEPSPLDEAREALLASVAREETRLIRRIKAVRGDLARGLDAETAAESARPFVAEAAKARRGTTRLVAVDWSSGEPETRELAIDPAKRPRDQVEAVFAEARRMKRGANVAAARLNEAEAKLARLGSFRSEVKAALSEDDLTAARRALRREDPSILPGLAPRDATARPSRGAGASAKRVPYRAFVSTSGARILVGRGAGDNDELTLHVARMHDLWLHAKDTPGAHVIVPLLRGRAAETDVLVEAALLAAHFSDARGEAIVDVSYADRRFVRKRRGSAPGEVQVDQAKTLVLRVDAGKLATLLAREEGVRA